VTPVSDGNEGHPPGSAGPGHRPGGLADVRPDGIRLRTPGGRRFVPRELPSDDVAAEISAGLGSAIQVRSVDDATCEISVGSDTVGMLAAHLGMLAAHLGMLDADFEEHEPPELVEHVRGLADRYRRASS
jgi:hypothetical protein